MRYKVEVLYDQGTVGRPEDGYLVRPPFFAVADGVSPPYSGEHPLLMVEGRTAGAVVAKAICDTFARASDGDSAIAILQSANQRVAELHRLWRRSLDRPDLLAGASVVAVKLGDPVEIVQIGDAIACWRLRSGKFGATENLGYAHEEHLLAIVARLMEEVGGDRAAMWERYHEPRCASLREHANRFEPLGFSVLNGQPEATTLFQGRPITLNNLDTLILCSDGLVSFEITRDSAELAQFVFGAYDEGGLDGVLARTRGTEAQKEARSHESHAEATAIAIRL